MVPVLALLFVLPKFKKKQKKTKEPVQTKSYEEIKKEETSVVSDEPQQKKIRPIETSNLTSDDFKGYLKERQNGMSRPKRAELPQDFIDRTEDYFPRRRRIKAEKPKTLAEEIKSLSPELKALILSGALDPKDFDRI